MDESVIIEPKSCTLRSKKERIKESDKNLNAEILKLENNKNQVKMMQ